MLIEYIAQSIITYVGMVIRVFCSVYEDVIHGNNPIKWFCRNMSRNDSHATTMLTILCTRLVFEFVHVVYSSFSSEIWMRKYGRFAFRHFGGMMNRLMRRV